MVEAGSRPGRLWLVVGLVVLVGGLGAVAAFRWLIPIVKVSDLRDVRRERPPR